MKKIGEVCSFFGGRATLGLLKRCFGVSGLKLRGALGYLRGFNLVDNQIEGVYHRFQGQKCSRSAHLELIWEIPAKSQLVATRAYIHILLSIIPEFVFVVAGLGNIYIS